MTTGELITALYTDYFDIGNDTFDDAAIRARIRRHIQQAVNRVIPFRPWPWAFADDDMVIAAGAFSGDVPLTFGWVGPRMTVWVSSQRHRVYPRDLSVVKRALEGSPGTASLPTIYAIGGTGDRLAAPGAPTVVAQGTTGATTYSYKIVAEREDGSTTEASTAGTVTNGNATLSATNFNRISWTAVPKAARYDVYRTVGGLTQGKIFDNVPANVLTKDDTGIAGDAATAPTVNTTSNLQQLHVYPRVTAETTIQLRDYKRKPPTLIDEVADPGGDNGLELKQIPEQYHETLLWDYAVKRLMRDEGDDRDPAQEMEFRQAMAEAWAEENNQMPRRNPRYGRRAFA